MKNKHSPGKKILSVILTLLLVLPMIAVGIVPLKAEAATPGTYYYKVTFEVTDDMDNCQMRWSLTGKTNNGTGSETTMASGGWTSDTDTGTKTYTLMEGTSAAGVFPTKVTLTDNNGAKYYIAGRSVGGYIHLYAGPSSSNLTEIYLNGAIARNDVDKLECGSGNGAWFYWNVKSPVFGDKSNYFTVNYTAGNNMPYINTVTVASTAQQSATVPASGTAYSASQTSATVKDQYGVVWYQDASWAVNSTNTAVTSSASMTGISAGTGRVNVTNAAKDYLGSSTSKTIYLNAYCGSVKSATIAVAITNIKYTVKFYDTNRSTVLKTQTVSHKNAATAPTSNPTKAYDSTYHYTWAG